MSGFIYIMSNPAMPKMFKVGKTVKDPSKDRITELSSSTSVPEPFKLEYYCFIEQHDKVELAVHQELHEYRPNPNREFFKTELQHIVSVIRSIGAQFGMKFEEVLFEEVSFDKENQAYNTDPPHSPSYLQDTQANDAELEEQISILLEYNPVACEIYNKLSKFPKSGETEFAKELLNIEELTDNNIQNLFFTKYQKNILNHFRMRQRMNFSAFVRSKISH